MRNEIEGIAHEVSVEDRDSRGAVPDHRMRQGGKVGPLPVVHPHIAGRIEQRTSRDCHHRVVSKNERPGLPEIGHDQRGRRLYGCIIKTGCITIDESKGAHGTVEVPGPFSRRSRQLMSLGIPHPEPLHATNARVGDNCIFADPQLGSGSFHAAHNNSHDGSDRQRVLGLPWLFLRVGASSPTDRL